MLETFLIYLREHGIKYLFGAAFGAVAWWLGLAATGFALAGPRGVLAVGLGAAVVAALSWHTARRFGGMTGDVLGAASELATLAALVVLAAR